MEPTEHAHTTKELKLTLPNEVWERIKHEQNYRPNESDEETIRNILIHFFFPVGLDK